ncbi:MAG: SDR family oxidoreductase [Thermodesulfobacteriota bacterium]
MDLKGKRALVLGGVRSIGKSVALCLAREGMRLAINWFDWESSVPELEAGLSAITRDFMLLRQNLLETEKIPALVDAAADAYGGLDALVLNIERGGWPKVHGPYTKEQWDLEVETTLRAKQWVFDAALPHLLKEKEAAVVVLTSIAAVVGRSGPAAPVFSDGYAAASLAARSLTRSFARRGAPMVRVNELMLGFMDTRHGPGTRGWELLSDKEKQDILDHTLLKRTGNPEEAAQAVRFLLSDATFMTGATLIMDGGFLLGGDAASSMPPGVVTHGESVFGK